MKILHGPQNIGGMAGVLAKKQSELGHKSYAYSFSENCYQFPADFTLKNPNSKIETFTKAINFSSQFEVFQFYFGESLLGNNLADVPWLSRLGKKIFFYFCGCDIRDEKSTIMNYSISACANCFPKQCSRNRDIAYKISKDYGRINFVSTPDLLEFVERSVLLPQVIDFDLINKILEEEANQELYNNSNQFIVAHAPTSRKIKGTDFIIDSIQKLQNRGLNIKLILIENMSHADALRLYRTADVAIDQLLIGSYGLVSAEMMALGVPTIAYLREDLLEKYWQYPPLINADPNNLENILLDLYENRDKLNFYKEAGITYAYRVHHPSIIAIKCLEYYEK